MRVLIFGAGGVGSVVGGFLARLGHDVSLLGRAWHLDVVKKQGLMITGIWGDYRIKALDCYQSVEEIRRKDKKFDLIILTVKSFDTAKAVDELLPFMENETILLSLQNGLGNIETILSKGIKPENYIVGRLIFGVELEPGVAKVTVNADDVCIGALPGVEPKTNIFQLSRTLTMAKIPTQAVPDILTYVWSKVIYNCALNAICSLYEMPYGKILDDPQTKDRMARVVNECYGVAREKRITLNPPDPEAFIQLLISRLIPSTASHFPSMLQDLKRGKRTDIDALNGAIARYARALGLEASENEALQKAIHERETF